jgi:hypothetical protein
MALEPGDFNAGSRYKQVIKLHGRPTGTNINERKYTNKYY